MRLLLNIAPTILRAAFASLFAFNSSSSNDTLFYFQALAAVCILYSESYVRTVAAFVVGVAACKCGGFAAAVVGVAAFRIHTDLALFVTGSIAITVYMSGLLGLSMIMAMIGRVDPIATGSVFGAATRSHDEVGYFELV